MCYLPELFMYMYMFVCMDVQLYLHVHVCMHMCTCTCMYECTYHTAVHHTCFWLISGTTVNGLHHHMKPRRGHLANRDSKSLVKL